MGHEMGHYVLGHVWQAIAFSALLILAASLYVAYRTAGAVHRPIRRRFGFTTLADVASLPLLLLLMSVFGLVVTPLELAFTRHVEHEADRFGLEITQTNHSAGTAFVKLQQDALANPRPGLLYKICAREPSAARRADRFRQRVSPVDDRSTPRVRRQVQTMSIRFSIVRGAVAAGVVATASAALAQAGVQSADLLKLRSVSGVEVSPDATRVAYIVENNDGAGRPYGQLWVMTIADGKSVRFGRGQRAVREPGVVARQPVDCVSRAGSATSRASSSRSLTDPARGGSRNMSGTNAPLPGSGSDDRVGAGRQANRVRLVRAGPETADATGDPVVITRYLYKPDAAEGMTRFNDNRRLHLFVVDVASGRVEQLTDGRVLRTLGRLVAERPGDRLSHESRRRSRRVLQLRRLRDEARGQIDPARQRDREQRVSPALVARRKNAGVPGDEARPHRSRNDDGRHARVGGQRRRHQSSRNRHASTTARARPNGRRMAARCCSRCRSAAACICIASRSRGANPSWWWAIAERSAASRCRRTVLAYTLATPSDLAAAVHRRPQDDRSQRGRAARQTARRRRVVHVRLERQQVRSRSVSDEADRPAPRAPGIRSSSTSTAGRTASRDRRSTSRIRCTRHAAGRR